MYQTGAAGLSKRFTRISSRAAFAIVVNLFIPLIAWASNTGVQTVTLDARLLNNSDGTSLLDPSVDVDIKIYSPNLNCVLYEEHQSVNTTTTDGRFSLQVGSVPGDSKRTGSDPGNSMVVIFQNQTAINASCGSYTPASGEGRILRITVKPSTTGLSEQLSPDVAMDQVPNALVAETLQGLDRDHVLALDPTTALTQANVANVFSTANYSTLTSLLAGTSNQYVTSTASGGAKIPSVSTAPASLATGQIWFSSTANAFQYYNGSSIQTIGAAAPASASGISSLGVSNYLSVNGTAGGTLTGPGTLDIANAVTSGSFAKISFNSRGLVTGGTGLVENDLPIIQTGGKVLGDAITSGTISGTTVFYSSGNVTSSGTVKGATVSSNLDTTKQLQLFDPAANSTQFISFTAPTLSSGYAVVFPASQGASGTMLTNDGSGHLSWTTPASGPGSLSSGKIWIGNASNVATAIAPFGDVTLSIAGSATVTQLQGSAVSASAPSSSGQMLRWNGSAWAPSLIVLSDIRSSLTGVNLFGTSCGVGQTLSYSSVGDTMICSNITIANTQVTWGSTGANLVFAGPATGGSAAPTFRALTSADLPAGISSQWTSGTGGNIYYNGGNVGIGSNSPAAILDVNGTGLMSAIVVPRDSQTARPSGTNGMIRYNTTSQAFEGYQAGTWVNLVSTGGGGGGGSISCPSGFTAVTSVGANFCIKTTSADNVSGATLGTNGSGSNVGSLISTCASAGGSVCSYAQLYSANKLGIINLSATSGTGATYNGQGSWTSETMFYPDAVNWAQNSNYCPSISGSGAFTTVTCSQGRSYFCCR